MSSSFRIRSLSGLLARRRSGPDPEVEAGVTAILADVARDGAAAVRSHAERLGDLAADAPLCVPRPLLAAALAALPAEDRERLERIAARIRAFAETQRAALVDCTRVLPGGAAGHQVAPVARAGCYAPGGRYPLPSSVLMTALTARVAGVREVWVASPRPAPLTLAAAALAGADGVLAVGGAQAIAALAYGAGEVPACDTIVGPGNAWVTAAKQRVAGVVGIDTLAGPSELVVAGDADSDPALIAADLLAQAEHDPQAIPILVSTSAALVGRVIAQIEAQLADLPSADIARRALSNGGAVLVEDRAALVAACDALAPEHLALHLADAEALAPALQHYGALFIGSGAAEVLGDYGAGPNHVLPTAGAARASGGLSVLNFLRVRTWLRIDDLRAARGLYEDAVWLGRAEGLEAHARSAARRLPAAETG